METEIKQLCHAMHNMAPMDVKLTDEQAIKIGLQAIAEQQGETDHAKAIDTANRMYRLKKAYRNTHDGKVSL